MSRRVSLPNGYEKTGTTTRYFRTFPRPPTGMSHNERHSPVARHAVHVRTRAIVHVRVSAYMDGDNVSRRVPCRLSKYPILEAIANVYGVKRFGTLGRRTSPDGVGRIVFALSSCMA